MSNLHGQAGRLGGPSQVTEREITYPTDLTLGSGRLNPEAIGWTRTQQINTDGIGRGLIGKGRNKRWEYWAILTPRHIVALVASDIDYAAVPSIWVLDRESGKTYASDEIAFSKSKVELPGTLDSGPSRVNALIFPRTRGRFWIMAGTDGPTTSCGIGAPVRC